MFEQDRGKKMSALKSTLVEAGVITGTLRKTATMEFTAFEWKIIVLALNEAQTMPNASKQLGDEIAELVSVQIKENIN